MGIINKISQIPKANIAKINGVVVSTMLSKNNLGLYAVPAGLIIPYNSAAALPSNWSLYSTADAKNIIGAGSTYAVDDNGAGTGTHQSAVAASGNHLVATTYNFVNTNSTWSGVNNAGDHSHTTDAFAYTPPYQGSKLIKADIGQDTIPQNGVLWSDGTDYGGTLDNIWTDGYYFQAAASLGTGGSNSVTGVATDSSGGHNHGANNSSGAGGGASARGVNLNGGHTHSSITLTMTPALNAFLLAAWEHASSSFTPGTNMIGMYESTTPPPGWFLCDGNNGTPDLRDKFITNTTQAGAGSAAGDGTVTAASAVLTHGNHSHHADFSGSGAAVARRHQAGAHADHAAINDNYTWLPPYYALAFIMFGG
jgi:hypothetical protein